MKVFRILGRNIRDAAKSVFRNFSLSIASITCITITLILVAISMVISYNINNFTKTLEDELNIVVYLNKNTTVEERNTVEQNIKNIENVESVVLKTKEQWKSEMQSDSEKMDVILSYLENNPLMDSFIVKVKAVDHLSETAKEIKTMDKIEEAKYGEDLVDNVLSVFNVIEKSTIAIVVALILVTVFLIGNTIKLTIFSRRNEIEIMRLVGASNLVIRLPFLFEGLFLGALGALIPIIVSIYGYILAFDALDGYLFSNIIQLVSPTPFIFFVALILLGIGAVVGMFGSYRAVRKYLKI